MHRFSKRDLHLGPRFVIRGILKLVQIFESKKDSIATKRDYLCDKWDYLVYKV